MKTLKKKITMIIEKTGTGFSAFCGDCPIYTTGKTMTELVDNAYEATKLFYDDSSKIIIPGTIKFEIDFKQFFQYYKVLNAKFLAYKIGMNPTLLSQYIQGHKKPSEKQTKKIILGIHQIGKELSEINLIYKN